MKNLAIPLSHLTDVRELYRLKSVISHRIDVLHKQQSEQARAAAWERLKNQPPGTVLYCCSEGTFMGGPFQRGDKMTVHCIQPRKKVLWVKYGPEGAQKFHGFFPLGILRYNLQLTPPANPIRPTERAFATKTGEILYEISL